MGNTKSIIIQSLFNQAKAGKNSSQTIRRYKKTIAESAQRELLNWSPSKKTIGIADYPFQIIDFFCGCGGMSLGFAALSRLRPFFKIVGGCDIDPEALKTYEKNFHAPGIIQDIRDLVDDKVAQKRFLFQLPAYDKSKPLVLIGCAPCQGFTSHRKKNWSKKDHRNTLVGAFAALSVQLKPVCIVMENVPEMLSSRYWGHFAEAKDIFEQSGYVVHQSIYNAASFGVPQERFRAVVIAMKKDFLLPTPLLDPAHYLTVRDAIGDLPPVIPGQAHPDDHLHRSAAHRESTIATIRAVSKNGGNRPYGVGPKCLDRIKGFSDVYGRLFWDRPSITITHYARNPASGRYVHPQQHRGLTTREAARLQSFPLGFEFVGSFDSIFKQIGEAVPPKLACAVASNVLIELLAKAPSEHEKTASIKSIMEPVSNSYSSVIAGIKIRGRR